MSAVDPTAPSITQPDAAIPRTVDEAMAELAHRFGENLPRLTDFIADSLLHAILTLPVTVQASPPASVLFKACATEALPVAPQLSGEFVVYVTEGSDVPVTPCS